MQCKKLPQTAKKYVKIRAPINYPALVVFPKPLFRLPPNFSDNPPQFSVSSSLFGCPLTFSVIPGGGSKGHRKKRGLRKIKRGQSKNRGGASENRGATKNQGGGRKIKSEYFSYFPAEPIQKGVFRLLH